MENNMFLKEYLQLTDCKINWCDPTWCDQKGDEGIMISCNNDNYYLRCIFDRLTNEVYEIIAQDHVTNRKLAYVIPKYKSNIISSFGQDPKYDPTAFNLEDYVFDENQMVEFIKSIKLN